MSGKMIDYLSSGTADYVYLLDIDPQNEMVETGDKTQIIHTFDDGSVRVASKGNQSYFDIEYSLSVLTEVQAETILDLWHDENKANGMERTFYWVHPIDGDNYVVRFLGVIQRKRTHQMYLYSSIDSIKLRVEAYALSGAI